MWPFTSKQKTTLQEVHIPDRNLGYFSTDTIELNGSYLELARTVEPPSKFNFYEIVCEDLRMPRQYLNFFLNRGGIGITEETPILPRQNIDYYFWDKYEHVVLTEYLKWKQEIINDTKTEIPEM